MSRPIIFDISRGQRIRLDPEFFNCFFIPTIFSAPIVMSDDFNEVGLSLLKYSGTVIGGLALHSLIILPIVFIIGKFNRNGENILPLNSDAPLKLFKSKNKRRK